MSDTTLMVWKIPYLAAQLWIGQIQKNSPTVSSHQTDSDSKCLGSSPETHTRCTSPDQQSIKQMTNLLLFIPHEHQV